MLSGFVQVDDDGIITSDLPCIKCGYNLRGLPRKRICPECGRTIEDSITAGMLPAAWIDRQANGFGWIAAGMIIAIFCPMCQVDQPYDILFLLPKLAIIMYGLWRITIPDETAPVSAAYETARKWVRLIMFGPAVAHLLAFGLGYVNEVVMEMIEQGVVVIDSMVILVTCLLGREVALRIGNQYLAKWAPLIGWIWLGLVITAIVSPLVIVQFLQPVNPSPLSTGQTSGWLITVLGKSYDSPGWFWLFFGVIALVTLITGIRLLCLPFEFHSHLRKMYPRTLSGDADSGPL